MIGSLHEMRGEDTFPASKPAERMQDVLGEAGKQEAAQGGGATDAEATDEGLDCQEPLCPLCSRQAPAATEVSPGWRTPRDRSSGVGASASISLAHFSWSKQVGL